MNYAARNKPVHPGTIIKDEVLPRGVSVKEAAEILGVGRPALSNLLNGNAALSPEMAVRIEKAFGGRSEELLAIQAEYDDFHARERGGTDVVRPYARFLEIRALQIEAWADELETRALLGVLLRKLVNSTATELSLVNFPAYDNSQKPGWDGLVESASATPWVPAGKSGWEFGTSKDPRQKADDDYSARIKSESPAARKGMTFVFVTPRNWRGKDDWVAAKRKEREWKDVKALDASDLEQWLEHSIPAQSWLHEKIGGDSSDILSLEEYWKRWASVTEPELSKELFDDAIVSFQDTLKHWLVQPPSAPFTVTAESVDEALAFLASILEKIESPIVISDRAIVICSPDGLRKVNKGQSSFIAVVASPEAEKALAGLQKKTHTIIVRDHSAAQVETDITLDRPSYETFRTALTSMGVDEDEVSRYARESGQSPTILRRRLSQVEEIKFPPWAADSDIAKRLVPLTLVGVWDSGAEGDQTVLSHVSSTTYEEVERSAAEIQKSEQSPLWAIGKFRGLKSKIDTLFAIHPFLTREDLDRFFEIAEIVLGEEDPALDLPHDKQWAASIYGKTRNHSSALRKALCETLVILAVHGNNLLQKRLGVDIEARVNVFIRELLKPLGSKTWLSQKHDLPHYAEAAPGEFLDILQEDLKTDRPKVHALLEPADSGMFGGCPRSGLLWALETLAWKPERLLRVAKILAEMSQREIDDNWSNKPESSLKAIFRAWMPQTAASVEERKKVLKVLTEKFPDIGWRLCIDQFDPYSTMGTYSSRPSWRNDASGAGQPVSGKERYEFAREALNIALDWPDHDERTLADLVERLQAIPDDQERVWDLIAEWAAGNPGDEKKANLREHIRRYAITRRGRRLNQEIKNQANEAYELLKPKDAVIRNRWLFEQPWVEESADELENENLDLDKREERIARQRKEALLEIWNDSGFASLKRLVAYGSAQHAIGWHLARDVLDEDERPEIIYKLLSDRSAGVSANIDACLRGIFQGIGDEERERFITQFLRRIKKEKKSEDVKILRLLKTAPFRQQTWQFVNKLPKKLQRRYWSEITPAWDFQEPEEIEEFVDALIDVDRPRAAFSAARLRRDNLSSNTLVRLLKEVATNIKEPIDEYKFHAYDVSRTLKILEERTDVSKDDLAELEFLYVEILRFEKHGIPNLERQVSVSPPMFMQVLALAYKRSDKGKDPAEWTISDPKRRESLAVAAYAILESVKRIPGAKNDGSIVIEDLRAWINETRELCKKYSREEIGDYAIGRLLSNCPPGRDGIWPCEPVRIVIEEIASKEIARGMAIGLFNARGVTSRGVGEGGGQERRLAEKYRNWSRELTFEYPYVADMLDYIARDYDHNAEWHDTDASVRGRLMY